MSRRSHHLYAVCAGALRPAGNDGSGCDQGYSRGQAGEPAQRGLWLYRLNLEYQREWGGAWQAVQQVAPVVDEEAGRFVVITVYTFYF